MDHLSILTGLPGEALIRQGLEDYKNGARTPTCLAILIAKPRLREFGLLNAADNDDAVGAELDLYHSFKNEPDAFSCYKSFINELVSFQHALDHRMRRLELNSIHPDH